jgi:hypothetical protein
MAKTNRERQADFRTRMREEGQRATYVWLTPEQATELQAMLERSAPGYTAALPVTIPKVIATKHWPLAVPKTTPKTQRSTLPSIPAKTPTAIVRDLNNAAALIRKKRAQIDKLEKDARGIEDWFCQTVDQCSKI